MIRFTTDVSELGHGGLHTECGLVVGDGTFDDLGIGAVLGEFGVLFGQQSKQSALFGD